MTGQRGDLSFGKLALFSLGAATAVLVVTTVLISVLRPGPVAGLIIGLVGVAAAIAAMGTVSTRMTRRAFGDPAADDAGPDTDSDADPGTGPRT